MVTLRIGVLACQGAFHEHVEKLNGLNLRYKLEGKDVNIETHEVRSANDLSGAMVGLIIPGKLCSKRK